MEKPLCIIPVRGGSKRFPRKNIALLSNKPLLAHTIDAALESQVFSKVCVSSDDDEILSIARQYGAHWIFKRPAELATDHATVKQVCIHLLNSLINDGHQPSEFAILLATSPLRRAADIRMAYGLLSSEADSVMSVVPYAHPPQRAVAVSQGYIKPYFGMGNMKRTQLLEVLYRHDGAVFFAKCQSFLKEEELYGKRVVPYFMSPELSVDIDSPIDLKWAEFLLQNSLSSNTNP